MTGGPQIARRASRPTHVFRVALQEDRATHREIEILSSCTLVDLAKAIVAAFEFEFDHAFGFYSNLTGPDMMRSGVRYELFADMGEKTGCGSVKRTRVVQAFPEIGHKMLFLFDYGDDWRFVLEVIGIRESETRVRYPRVLSSVGAPPQQYRYDEEDFEADD